MDKRPVRLQWLEQKLAAYYPDPEPEAIALVTALVAGRPDDAALAASESPYNNPFTLDDLMVFDSDTLTSMLRCGAFGLHAHDYAAGLYGGPVWVIERLARSMPMGMRVAFREELAALHRVDPQARRRVLDAFFWDLIYWHCPGWCEDLTCGELPVPGLFARAAPDIRGRTVLEIGAGTGRATLACLEQNPRHIYAVEPAPPMRHMLQRKLRERGMRDRVTVLPGRFDAVPLPDSFVDVVFAYSAFTSDPAHGGKPGFDEMQRVTRSGGAMLIFWPPLLEYQWLADLGFEYIPTPMDHEPYIHFGSLACALRCARRFYANNVALQRYLQETQRPDIPFWLAGFAPPHDYCRLVVHK
ncbi:MAG: class I SAM-dependent methyltransferase [Ktedonobacterales bacterium]